MPKGMNVFWEKNHSIVKLLKWFRNEENESPADSELI